MDQQWLTVLPQHQSSSPTTPSMCTLQRDQSMPCTTLLCFASSLQAPGELGSWFLLLTGCSQGLSNLSLLRVSLKHHPHQAQQGWLWSLLTAVLTQPAFTSCRTVVNPLLLAVLQGLSFQQSMLTESLSKHKTIALYLLQERKTQWHLFPFSYSWWPFPYPCCLRGSSSHTP